MPNQLITVTENDFGGGINKLSSEDNIPETFVEDLVNMDCTALGYLRKRPGSATHMTLPVTVGTRVDATSSTTSLILTFDSSIDLTDHPIVPILVIVADNTKQNDGTADRRRSVWVTDWSAMSNVLSVNDAQVNFSIPTDREPQAQAVVYGLNTTQKANQLSIHKGRSEEKLVAGAGGNLFFEGSDADLDTATSSLYFLDSSFAVLGQFAASSTAHHIGPAFYDDSESPQRDRGFIKGDGVSVAGFTDVTDIAYQSGSGYTRYTLSFPSKTVSGTPISADLDYLTIRQCGYSVNQGTFLIKAFDLNASASTITIDVLNSNRTDSDWDEGTSSTDAPETGAQAAVRTDVIRTDYATALTTPIIKGDSIYQVLADTNFLEGTVLGYQEWTTNKVGIVLDEVTQEVEIASSETIEFTRTTDLIHLDSSGDQDALVKGDHLTLSSSVERRVTYLYMRANLAVSDFTGSVLTVSSTEGFEVGQKLYYTSDDIESALTAVYTISEVTSGTTLTVAETTSASGDTGDIKGYSVNLNSTYEATGNQTASIARRAILGKHPECLYSGQGYIERRPIWESSTEAQPFLSSVQVGGNTYFVSGVGTLKKFDGDRVMDATLPRFQLYTGISADYENPAITATDKTPAYLFTSGGNKFNSDSDGTFYHVLPADIGKFSVGDRVQRVQLETGSTDPTLKEAATIANIVEDVSGTFYKVYTEETAFVSTTFSGENILQNLTTQNVYRYYVRLEYIDVNSNIHTSAVLGSDDLRIDLLKSATVQLNVNILPGTKVLDRDRVLVKVFRSRRNETSPLYQVAQATIGRYDSPFVTIYDRLPDVALENSLGIDSTNNAHKDAPELVVGLDESPQEIKYLAAADNRLVIGNYQSSPQVDIRLETIGVGAFDTDLLYPLGLELAIDSATGVGLAESIYFHYQEQSSGPGAPEYIKTTDNGILPSVVSDNLLDITNITASSGRIRLTASSVPADIAVGDIVELVRKDIWDGWGVASIDSQPFEYDSRFAGHFEVAAVGATTIDLFGEDGLLSTASYDSARDINAVCYIPTAIKSAHSADQYVAVFAGTNFALAGVGQNPRVTSITTAVEEALEAASMTVLNNNSVAALNVLAMERLARAINAVNSIRCVDSIGFSDPEGISWCWAEAGATSVDSGKLTIRALDSFIATIHTDTDIPFFIYVNDTAEATLTDRLSSGTNSVAFNSYQLSYPSRLLRSYQNFPESFDQPYTSDANLSDSVIDVNPSDGEEIVALASFLGESVTGGANLSGIVLAFKPNAIYAVDINLRQAIKLESFGTGCSFDGAAVSTSRGVFYVHTSGIYRVLPSLQVEFVGKTLDETASGTILSVGSDDRLGGVVSTKSNAVRLSMGDGSTVFNYFYTREESGGYGGWSRYDSINANAWARKNDGTEFFASSTGVVNKLIPETYVDDTTAFTSTIKFRPTNFGESGRQKFIPAFNLHFRNESATADDTTVYTAVDLNEDYRVSDTFSLIGTNRNLDNLSDTYRSRVEVLSFSVKIHRADFIQIKVENNGDEPLEITALDYKVAGLSPNAGTKEATDTL